MPESKYYQENKEKIKVYRREYYLQNRERIIEYQKQYNDQNRDKILERQKAKKGPVKEKKIDPKIELNPLRPPDPSKGLPPPLEIKEGSSEPFFRGFCIINSPSSVNFLSTYE